MGFVVMADVEDSIRFPCCHPTHKVHSEGFSERANARPEAKVERRVTHMT